MFFCFYIYDDNSLSMLYSTWCNIFTPSSLGQVFLLKIPEGQEYM